MPDGAGVAKAATRPRSRGPRRSRSARRCSTPAASCCSTAAPPSAPRALRGQPLGGPLEDGLRRFAAAELRDLRGALAAADAAVADADPVALATAYGTAVAALHRGAYEVTLAHAGRDDPEGARKWLLIRDFRQATRFTRPGVDATTALDGLATGDLSPADALDADPQGPPRRLPGAPGRVPRRGRDRERARLRAGGRRVRWRSPPATG